MPIDVKTSITVYPEISFVDFISNQLKAVVKSYRIDNGMDEDHDQRVYRVYEEIWILIEPKPRFARILPLSKKAKKICTIDGGRGTRIKVEVESLDDLPTIEELGKQYETDFEAYKIAKGGPYSEVLGTIKIEIEVKHETASGRKSK